MESPDLIRNKYRQYPWDRPNFVAPLTSVPGNLAGGRLGKVKARSRLRYKGGREGQRSKKLRALCTTFNYLVEEGATRMVGWQYGGKAKTLEAFHSRPLATPLRPPCRRNFFVSLRVTRFASILPPRCHFKGTNKALPRDIRDTFAARRPSFACNILLSI